MKKFIKALERERITDSIIRTAVLGNKLVGLPSFDSKDMNAILDIVFKDDEDLEDLFLQEAREVAVNIVLEYIKKKD